MLYLVVKYEVFHEEKGAELPVIVFTSADIEEAAKMCKELDADHIVEFKLGEECYHIMH